MVAPVQVHVLGTGELPSQKKPRTSKEALQLIDETLHATKSKWYSITVYLSIYICSMYMCVCICIRKLLCMSPRRDFPSTVLFL